MFKPFPRGPRSFSPLLCLGALVVAAAVAGVFPGRVPGAGNETPGVVAEAGPVGAAGVGAPEGIALIGGVFACGAVGVAVAAGGSVAIGGVAGGAPPAVCVRESEVGGLARIAVLAVWLPADTAPANNALKSIPPKAVPVKAPTPCPAVAACNPCTNASTFGLVIGAAGTGAVCAVWEDAGVAGVTGTCVAGVVAGVAGVVAGVAGVVAGVAGVVAGVAGVVAGVAGVVAGVAGVVAGVAGVVAGVAGVVAGVAGVVAGVAGVVAGVAGVVAGVVCGTGTIGDAWTGGSDGDGKVVGLSRVNNGAQYAENGVANTTTPQSPSIDNEAETALVEPFPVTDP